MFENTYWNHQGKYQVRADELHKLIPDYGRCEDVRLEAKRCMSQLYYDLYNNGAGNFEHCYREEWDFLRSFRSCFCQVSDDDSDEMSLSEFRELDMFVCETIRVQAESDEEAYQYPPDGDRMYELFEKLTNAVIVWAYEKHGKKG